MTHEVIEGDRVRLRPTAEADLDVLAVWFGDPGVYEFWDGVALSRDEVAEKYLGRRSPHVECFVIETMAEPVGFIQYHRADVGDWGGGLDVVVVPARRREGVGRCAVLALTSYLRNRRGWQRITVDPNETNARGVAFWTAVGFAPEQLVNDDRSRPPYWLMVFPR